MKLPVIFNVNKQIQDQDGEIIADLWKNPNAVEDGEKIVRLLNAVGDEVSRKADMERFGITEEMMKREAVRSGILHEPIATSGDVSKPVIKKNASEWMKEYWRKRKEAAIK